MVDDANNDCNFCLNYDHLQEVYDQTIEYRVEVKTLRLRTENYYYKRKTTKAAYITAYNKVDEANPEEEATERVLLVHHKGVTREEVM